MLLCDYGACLSKMQCCSLGLTATLNIFNCSFGKLKEPLVLTKTKVFSKYAYQCKITLWTNCYCSLTDNFLTIIPVFQAGQFLLVAIQGKSTVQKIVERMASSWFPDCVPQIFYMKRELNGSRRLPISCSHRSNSCNENWNAAFCGSV